MILSPSGTFLYSPTDLVSYLEGDFASWCDRMALETERAGKSGRAATGPGWLKPDEDEELDIAAREGDAHEARHLAALKARVPGLVEIQRGDPAAGEKTAAAMRAGAPIIYQARLTDGAWQGYPDFLHRAPGRSSLGDYHYYPADTKLARSAKPYFLVQLSAYARMLEEIQGTRPRELVFVLGNGDEVRFDTGDFFYYVRRLTLSFLDFQRGLSAGDRPDPALDRGWGRWTGTAEHLLAEADHLSLVAGMTRGQIRRLGDAGIATRRALAATRLDHVPKINDGVLARLRQQARLQLRSDGADAPAWEPRPASSEEPRRGLALLPPPSPGDVFFDIEGFPYGQEKLEYLFGAVVPAGESPDFLDWWAHDAAGEQRALEEFIDWVVERRRKHPDLHVYHYAAYEPSAIGRLMGKYATREDEVDELLRGEVFVDLYTVLRQGFVVGVPSYSLKKVERLYLGARVEDIVSAGASVVEYDRWLASGEPRAWAESPILHRIRDYNEVDCRSTLGLRDWLLERRRESGIDYVPDPNSSKYEEKKKKKKQQEQGPDPDDLTALRLVARGRARPPDDEQGRLDRLVGWLVEYHRREERPMWWRRFARHKAPWDTLEEDVECLARLARTGTPPRDEKRSQLYEYGFDPEQVTKLGEGSKCLVAGHHDLACSIFSMDEEAGTVVLKSTQPLPDALCLIPDEHVSAAGIKKAIGRYAAAWEEGRVLSQAVDDLLRRRPPRVKGRAGGALVEEGGEFLDNVIRVARELDGTTLCIQGPPGTGKTYTAAAIIAELMRTGTRVGVTANSHKVIYNLLGAVIEERAKRGESGSIFKVGKVEDEGEEPLVMAGTVTLVKTDDVAGAVGPGLLVGGTAWAFSRPDMEAALDYLFVDEAGQFSLANAVAVGLSTRNLVLVGDQMQLSQPLQGSHPGETGTSCLEYVLHGHPTVPADRGIFLGKSYRMHPDVCGFISAAIYEGRLHSADATAAHRAIRAQGDALVAAETGIAWVPVAHAGCGQSSMEEVEAIGAIVDELLGRTVVDRDGGPRRLTIADILVVAPFNLQVRALRARLPSGAKVGSVDLFQGQEAAVVIVSLCASTVEEAPRGAGFVLSPNRLNVAISRAQALAIVVGSPALANGRCRSIEEMKLVNLLCRLIQYAEGDE